MEAIKNYYSMLIIILFILAVRVNIQAQNELDKLLDMDMSDLMDIKIVTASKTLQRVEEVPATVKIITSEEIRNRGYLTLEEALSDLPGFNFRNINGFNCYIFQRGIPNQNNLTLLLVDGIQINELNSGGFYAGGQFDLDNVKQIEVVYGPASSLYGTNAVLGIINIITKSAKDEKGLSANFLYGSFNTINSSIRYGYYDPEKDLGLKFSGMFKSSDKADLAGAEGDNNWTDNMENFEDDYSFSFKGNYKNIMMGAVYQNKRASRTTNYKSIGTDYQDYGTLWNIAFFNAYVKGEFSLTDNLGLNSQVYFRDASVLDNTIGFINESGQAGYYRPNNLIGFETLVSYKPVENLHIIGGVVLEYENLAESFSRSSSGDKNIKPPPPGEPNYLHNNLLSLYLQSEYVLIKNFSITAGARYDNSSFYGDVLTPRIGLVYHQGDFYSKLLFTQAFRAPKPWDYTSGTGNPDLKPEEMESFELDASYMFSENVMLKVSLYRNTLEELITQETVEDGWRWTNNGWVKVNGAEVELNYSKGPLKYYLNYTYNYPYDNQDQLLNEISKHCANAGFTYSFSKMFRLNMRGNFIGDRLNPQIITATGSNKIDAAFLIHSTISMIDLYGFDFFLSIKNILDTEYYHTSNRPPERYRQPQRTITIKIEYKLF